MKWVSVFKYIEIEYGEDVAYAENLTQRVCFDNNVQGDKLRIRFTNKYGKHELRIKKATIGRFVDEHLLDAKEVTLGGNKEIVLSPGQESLSDEISFEVKPGERLAVNFFFKDRIDIDGMCCFWAEGGAEVYDFAGDVTTGDGAEKAIITVTSPSMKDDPNAAIVRRFMGFDVVQVHSSDETKVVAAFGDSITHMSFYTNPLQKRIYKWAPGEVSFINCGIGGNRLVDDATFVPEAGKRLVFFGKAGVERFEKDVFGLDEVDAVLILIGINDIMHPIQLENKHTTTEAKDIIEGYKKITACAHENGAEVFVGTITPAGNDEYPSSWIEAFEKVRNEVNEWIRKGELIDGFFDFDKELKDEEKPGYMISSFNIGDGLHPNILGGTRMADCVDLTAVLG